LTIQPNPHAAYRTSFSLGPSHLTVFFNYFLTYQIHKYTDTVRQPVLLQQSSGVQGEFSLL